MPDDVEPVREPGAGDPQPEQVPADRPGDDVGEGPTTPAAPGEPPQAPDDVREAQAVPDGPDQDDADDAADLSDLQDSQQDEPESQDEDPGDPQGTEDPEVGLLHQADGSAVEDDPRDAAETPDLPGDDADLAPPAPGEDAPTQAVTPWQRLRGSLRPTMSRSQLMAGLLCALLGFALVIQVRQTGQAELSSLRQDDLVRLLDEVTVRAEQLDVEVSRLRDSRDELVSGTGQAQAALEVAQQRATTEGILSGRLPAQGPGVVIVIGEPDATQPLAAQHLFNLLEELRNAGAEVVEVNGTRLVTSSSFVDGPNGRIVLDGSPLTPPYRWAVIGDPATLDRALEIPGGALPTIRTAGGTATTHQETLLTIDAVVDVTAPEFARPADAED